MAQVNNSSGTPSKSEIAADARTLIRRAFKGSLASLDSPSGAPYASLITLATDAGGAPADLRAGLRYAWGWPGLMAILIMGMILNLVLNAKQALDGCGRITVRTKALPRHVLVMVAKAPAAPGLGPAQRRR